MGGSSFELLMQEIFNQQQRMEQLIEENEDLQRQLADLRAGRGILLDICGQQFALNGETLVATPQPIPAISDQDASALDQPTINMALHQPLTSEQPTLDIAVAQSPTVAMVINQPVASIISETDLPDTDAIEPLTSDSEQNEDQMVALAPAPSFLEEMLIDEFAAAATSPMSVWKGSETKKLPPIDEDEKAILRRELIGSFLLE